MRRQALVAAAVAAVLAVPLTAQADTTPTGVFQGIDGLLHQQAPGVVLGTSDELFYGPDFDVACADGGAGITAAMDRLGRLARTIERSGRKVIFTVAPNKSAVLSDRLDPTQFPHGACDAAGLDAQDAVLDSYSDPDYLPLRQTLQDQSRQMYWRTDLHWTTVGGSVFAQQLASSLDPRLGRRQRYSYTTYTSLGGLNAALNIDSPETVDMAHPRTKVKVHPLSGDPGWAPLQVTFDHSWESRPARLTWPGRTLLLGDSFMFYALENLRPIFQNGRFMWVVHSDPAALAKAIARSHTIVLESVQMFAPEFDLATPAFRHQVARALRTSR